ncbi:hypothetical protein LZ30DRAFT_122006 [Colletotrichum cereale]|nr:hypothetical protein LZ30DRAFT_122006 [Colletotrichum cereale]
MIFQTQAFPDRRAPLGLASPVEPWTRSTSETAALVRLRLLLVYAALRHKDPRTLRLGTPAGAGKRRPRVWLTRSGPLKIGVACRASPPTGWEAGWRVREEPRKPHLDGGLVPCTWRLVNSRGGEGLPSPSCPRAWRRQGWSDHRGEDWGLGGEEMGSQRGEGGKIRREGGGGGGGGCRKLCNPRCVGVMDGHEASRGPGFDDGDEGNGRPSPPPSV